MHTKIAAPSPPNSLEIAVVFLHLLENDVVDVSQSNANTLQEEIQNIGVESTRLLILFILVEGETEVHLQQQIV